jgi:Transglycosylase-like domain
MSATDTPSNPKLPRAARRPLLLVVLAALVLGAIGLVTASAGDAQQPVDVGELGYLSNAALRELDEARLERAAETSRADVEALADALTPPTTVAPPTTTTTVPPTTTTTTTAPPPPPPPPPTTVPPAPAPAPAPPPAVAPNASGSGYNDPNNPAAWDRLAQCESGGNWAANTGNGYYGGIQFSLASWQGVGGPGRPDQASRETQIAMGQRLWNQGGWGHWPACSSKLGYR